MLLVGEVREQGVGEDVDRGLQAVEVVGVLEVVDEGAVDLLDRVVDHEVLGGEAVDHRLQLGVGLLQVGEDRVVLQRVVLGDGAAVAAAEGAQRPVVLAQRHLAQGRARLARRDRSVADLGDDVAQLGELLAQVVVDVDQVLAGGAAAGAVLDLGARGGATRPRRLVPLRLGEAAAVVGGRGDAEALVLAAGARLGGGPGRGGGLGARLGNDRLRRRRARRGPALARGGDQLAHRRRHLGGEGLDRPRLVGDGEEAGDALLERQPRQLLGLALGRAGERAGGAVRPGAGDVEQAAHLARVAAGGRRRRVDRRVAGGDVGLRQVGDAGQPAVAEPPGQVQHPRLVGADPEADPVRRRRPAGGAAGPVVLALETDAAAGVGVPERPHQPDRLLQRRDALPRPPPRPAHRLDRVPEGAGAEPELDPAAAQQVERGRRPGQHRRRAQRQVDDVGRQPDPVGAGGDVGEQRPGVEEARLVGVVLVADQVEPGLLGQFGQPHHDLGRLRRRGDEGAEFELVAVVRAHRDPTY